MKPASPNTLARTLRSFFADHLPRVRGTSPHTVHSYRDTFVLLLRFIADRRRRSVADLDVENLGPQDVLVDVGCGKGRVINWWLDQGLRNRMVGLEIDPAVASATARRLSAFGNVMIIHDDATTGVPDDATLLYMYNPFDRAATTRFKDNLARQFRGRGITALYWNPQWLEVFEGDPRWATQLIELTEVSDPRITEMDRTYAVVALRPA